MITVNLRPGQKRKRTGSPFAGVSARAKAIGARVKDPLLLASAAAWIGVLLWLGWVWTSNTRELHALTPHLEQVRVEHKRFKNFIGQKRHQELIRDSLVSQIGVIRTVDGDRYVWPHVMDEVARALPAYTWLTEMSPSAGRPAAAGVAVAAADSTADTTTKALSFKITGRTVDIQAYTRFLRQLEASPWVQEVTPISAMTVVENERPVTAFTLTATFHKADSAYIHTVALSQSVR
jgi:Tfp pilus assembly protein PilN